MIKRNTFDTIKFHFPSDLIIYNRDNFTDLRYRDGILVSSTYNGSDIPGLAKGGIVIGNGSKCMFNISSKLLGNSYFDGINSNNIDYVFDIIKRYTGVDFDNNSVIDYSVVQRIDAFKNVIVDGDVRDYSHAFSLIGLDPSRFKQDVYEKSGFVWSKIVGPKCLLRGYDKVLELSSKGKSHANSYFLSCYDKSLILNSFRNVFRFECENVKFKSMRDDYLVDTNSLSCIFDSRVNVVKLTYDKMVKKDSLSVLNFLNSVKSECTKWRDVEKVYGRYAIFDMLGEWELVVRFMMEFYAGGSNPSRMKKELKQDFNKWKQRKRDEAIRDLEESSSNTMYGDLIKEVEYKMSI